MRWTKYQNIDDGAQGAGDQGGGSQEAPAQSADTGGQGTSQGGSTQTSEGGQTQEAPKTRNQLLFGDDYDPQNLTTDQMKALLSVDPVATVRKQKKAVKDPATGRFVKAPDQGKQTQQQGTQQQQQPAAQPKTAQPAQPAAPTVDPNIQALTGVVDKLVQQQVQQQQPAQEDEEEEDFAAFNVQLPNEFLEALDSEDRNVRAQAMTAAFNGVARMAVQRAIKVVGERFANLPEYIATTVNNINTARENSSKFYSQFPELNNQVYHPIIAKAAEALEAEYVRRHNQRPNLQSPEFHKALGSYVKAILANGGGVQQTQQNNGGGGGQTPQGGVQTQQQQTAPNNGGGAFWSGSGVRPPASRGGPASESAEIMSIVRS